MPEAALQYADAITAARFSITIDGYEIATFAGKVKPPMITLRRGMSGATELWAWHEAVLTGHGVAARKSASLVTYNAEGKAVARYWLVRAHPAGGTVAQLGPH